MNKFVTAMKQHGKQYGMVLALAAIVILFQVWTNGILLRPLVAFVGAITALLMVNFDMGVVPTVTIGLLIGALIGAWQGLWTAYIGVLAFITSLAGMLIFRGLTIAVLEGRSIGPLNPAFRAISTSFVPDVFGGRSLNITALVVGLLLCLYVVGADFFRRRETVRHGSKAPSTGYLSLEIPRAVRESWRSPGCWHRTTGYRRFFFYSWRWCSFIPSSQIEPLSVGGSTRSEEMKRLPSYQESIQENWYF